MQEIYFRNGDKVSHQGFGNGTVISTNNGNKNYAMSVQFGDEKRNFTLDGKYIDNDLYPSLFQGHDRFIKEPNKPIFEPKYGELVWAKVNGCWCVYYYSGEHVTLPSNWVVKTDPKHTKGGYLATEIRPFKGEIPND